MVMENLYNTLVDLQQLLIAFQKSGFVLLLALHAARYK